MSADKEQHKLQRSYKTKILIFSLFIFKLVLERLCIPSPSLYANITNTTLTQFNLSYTDFQSQQTLISLVSTQYFSTDQLINYMSDLIIVWPILLASIGVAFVVSFIYLLIIRCCGGLITYITMILILGTFIVLGIFFHLRVNYFDSTTDNNGTYRALMRIASCTCFTVACLFFLYLICMCERIRLAIGLVKASARLMGSVCTLAFVPIFTFFITIIFYVYWIVVSVYFYYLVIFILLVM